MFDVIASGNPETMQTWKAICQAIHREPNIENHTKMDRCTDDHSFELYEDISRI
ncbi:hypothetical protein Bca4012_092568 [Brassica carinata]